MAEAEAESPATAVLDASALLAHLNDEDGASAVRAAMKDGAAISVANWAEVLSKLAERGEDPGVAAAEMRGAELVGKVVSVEPITEDDCIENRSAAPGDQSSRALTCGSSRSGARPPPRSSGAHNRWRVDES